MANNSDVPKAKQIVKELAIHDEVRLDEYYWLNERENPKVIDYLNAENNYYHSNTEHTKDFQTSFRSIFSQ